MLITEANFHRKSHRVDVPLFVEVGDKTYQAVDWSIGGLAIRSEELKYSNGELVAAQILLPLGNAKLILDVQLVTRRVEPDKVGFEFKELSPKNRRILRHFIQMYVDGKIDNAEDLIAISTAPEVITPLNDALNLSEENTEILLRGFKRRGLVAAGLIIVFAITFITVLFYNTTYRLETTGVVVGNVDRITANYGGELLQIDAKMDTFVKAGSPLFHLRNIGASSKFSSGKSGRFSSNTSLNAEKELLVSLKQEMISHQGAYHNALTLFKQHLITRKDLENVENGYRTSRTAYHRQKTLIDSVGPDGVVIGGEPLYPIIRAKHDGQVIAISGNPGSYVGASDVVVILQRNDKAPQVIISVANKDVLNLHIGMESKIYVPFQDMSYTAVITAIGRAATNTASTESMEASLNETLVTLSFEDTSVRLPFDSRVKVWIKTF